MMHPAVLLPVLAACGACVFAIWALARAVRTLGDWSFAAGMAILAMECGVAALTTLTGEPSQILRYQVLRLAIVSLLPGIWLIFSLCYSRGNAGDFLARTRYWLAAAFLLPVAVVLGFRSQLLVGIHYVHANGHWLVAVGWPGLALSLWLLIGSVLILMNLERTFRASVGTMRWRIKFMILGVALLFVVRIFTCTQTVLFRETDVTMESLNAGALIVGMALMARAFFRTGDVALNVYPSQRLLQSSLTVLGAGMYLVLVGLLAKVVAYLGGDAGFAVKAFILLAALVVLVILLQSDRVRLRFAQFVSRHLQRPFFDYRTVWIRFMEGTASGVEASSVSRVVVRLTADLFQALSVGVWLVDDRKDALTQAASTFLSEIKAEEVRPQKSEVTDLIGYFQEHPLPVDFETPVTPWAELLRRIHPSQFDAAGHRVCVPLVARGEVLGFLLIGDRVGGAAFGRQDFDMLQCIGDHVTANLLNVQLSRRLLQAKEFEAFQTMAAFFVHDLKNAASTLNLMLQNLPIHFDDPAFREDALRGMGKSVSHINDLIGRLTALRHELKVALSDSDLNEVVSRTLVALETGPEFPIVKRLGSIARVPLDREQMAKVITNLVINAREATAGPGEISVTTRQIAGEVVLEVTDQGSGMSPEFVRHSLFRAFQTTKKKGLGIGMFQSKMIVEAHGGRITVVTQPGSGSTFQVYFPVPKPAK